MFLHLSEIDMCMRSDDTAHLNTAKTRKKLLYPHMLCERFTSPNDMPNIETPKQTLFERLVGLYSLIISNLGQIVKKLQRLFIISQ